MIRSFANQACYFVCQLLVGEFSRVIPTILMTTLIFTFGQLGIISGLIIERICEPPSQSVNMVEKFES